MEKDHKSAAEPIKVETTYDWLSSESISCPTKDEWNKRDAKEREAFLDQLNASYHAIVDEMLTNSDACAITYLKDSKSLQRWRKGIILATGILATLNILAAYKWQVTNVYLACLLGYLPLLAAIFASGLVIYTNLESFYDFFGKARTYRESRELFLDAHREFEMLWHVYVRPFGNRAEACCNAAVLYGKIVLRDKELREKIKELTIPQKDASTSSKGNASQK